MLCVANPPTSWMAKVVARPLALTQLFYYINLATINIVGSM